MFSVPHLLADFNIFTKVFLPNPQFLGLFLEGISLITSHC
jgi:hypothetical protein